MTSHSSVSVPVTVYWLESGALCVDAEFSDSILSESTSSADARWLASSMLQNVPFMTNNGAISFLPPNLVTLRFDTFELTQAQKNEFAQLVKQGRSGMQTWSIASSDQKPAESLAIDHLSHAAMMMIREGQSILSVEIEFDGQKKIATIEVQQCSEP